MHTAKALPRCPTHPEANHNPVAVVNGQTGKAPIIIDAQVGVPLDLDASATTDPDGNRLKFNWTFYPEAGTMGRRA